MPISNQRVIKIILEECESIEERCSGYSDKLIGLLADIIEAEEEHRVKVTRIQQKIDDRCKACGDFLAKNQ